MEAEQQEENRHEQFVNQALPEQDQRDQASRAVLRPTAKSPEFIALLPNYLRFARLVFLVALLADFFCRLGALGVLGGFGRLGGFGAFGAFGVFGALEPPAISSSARRPMSSASFHIALPCSAPFFDSFSSSSLAVDASR
jgi:hypothetical protein